MQQREEALPALRFLGGPPTLSPYSASSSSPACLSTYASFMRIDRLCSSFGAAAWVCMDPLALLWDSRFLTSTWSKGLIVRVGVGQE